MPDEPPPPPPASDSPKSTGLPSNIAAALACIPLIGGIVFYVLEKQDSFVRFYAMQSIILGGVFVLCWIVYSIAFAILTTIPPTDLPFLLFFNILSPLITPLFLVLS